MSSSTLTSSVINKSGKTAAPKAVARRRPAAARAAPPTSKDKSAASATAIDSTPTEPSSETQSVQQQTSANVQLAAPQPPLAPATDVSTQKDVSQETSTPSAPPPTQEEAPAQEVASTQPAQADTAQAPTSDITASSVTAEPTSDTPTIVNTAAKSIIPAPRSDDQAGDRVASAPTAQVQTPASTGSAISTTVVPDESVAQDTVQTPTLDKAQGPSSQVAGVKRKRAQPKKTAPRTAPRREEPVAPSSARVELRDDTRPSGPVQSIETADPAPDVTQAEKDIARQKQKKQKKVGATRKAGAASSTQVGEVDGVAGPAKKALQKRAPKSAARVAPDDDGEGEAIEDEAAAGPKPKKRRKRKQVADGTAEGADGEQQSGDGEEESEESEESDPELHEIDPNAVTMFELARYTKYGKTSERENKMVVIDWAEVNRKRREDAPIQPIGAQAGGEEEQNETPHGEGREPSQAATPVQAQARAAGPQLRMVNGEIQVVEDTLRLDRQAQAAADAANLEIVEDNDLTKRVNRLTWINDKKRDVKERVSVYKMKSDPWSDADTDRFYDALRMFGTDFFIISKMFEPRTRRQMKLKFVREERIDPARINAALAGGGVPMDLEHYAEATGQSVESFKDPRVIEAELELAGEKEKEEIEKKKQDHANNRKQHEIKAAHDREIAQEKSVQAAAKAEQRAINRARKRKGQYGTGTF